jgi:hypothetical protein
MAEGRRGRSGRLLIIDKPVFGMLLWNNICILLDNTLVAIIALNLLSNGGGVGGFNKVSCILYLAQEIAIVTPRHALKPDRRMIKEEDVWERKVHILSYPL